MEDIRATRREEPICVDTPPRFIAGHQILEELGRGGMGVVYRARQIHLQRVVALKMIPSAGARREDLLRFRAEAQAVARLSHPHIVPIYEVGEHDGMPFYTMEYLAGGTLEQHLDRRRPGPREAACLVEQLARAAHHAHRQGILHRDLKPGNVLLASRKEPDNAVTLSLHTQAPLVAKIADFGLARRLDGSGHHTRTGAILGTPAYMAPEQALGRRDQGPTADVWSLGVILFECLTGRTAFEGTSVLHTLELVRREEPPAPSTLNPNVPRDLETVCLRCLEKDPARRYASAADLADDLRRWLDGEPVRTRPVGVIGGVWKWARRRPTAAALVATTVALAAAVAAAVPLHIMSLRAEAEAASRAALEAHEEARQSGLLADGERGLARVRELLGRGLPDDAALLAATLAGRIDDGDGEAARQLRDAALALYAHALQSSDEGRRRLTAGQKAEEFLARRDEALFVAHAGLLDDAPVGARPVPLLLAALEAFPDLTALPEDRRAPLEQARREVLVQLAEATAPADANEALRLLDGLTGVRGVHRMRARYLERIGQPDAARVERQHAAMTSPVGAIDALLAAQERLRSHDYNATLQELDRAIARDPELFWAHFLRAAVQLKRGKPDEAVVSLGWCVHRRPRFIWPYLLRANLHTLAGRLADAAADLERAAGLGPDRNARFGLNIGRGLLALRARQPRAAQRHFERAVRERPGHPAGHANLAVAHWQRGNQARALGLMEHAIALSPAPDVLYRKRAGWYAGVGRPAEALADLERLRPLTAADRAERGRMFYALRRYADAVVECDTALKDAPDSKVALRVRAESLLELGRPREAVAAFGAYLRRERAADAFARRAAARSACGDFAGVIDDYTQALGMRPDPVFLCGRGWAYLISNAPKLALADFERALNAAPTEALVGRATAKLDLGQPREALADVARAMERPPGSSRVLYAAARVMARAGAAGRALGPLELAVRALPEAERKAFWRDRVRKDAAMKAVTLQPGFRRLDETFTR